MLHRPFYRLLGQFLKKYDRRMIASKILWQDSFDYSIQNAVLVNSRSILFACNIHPQEPLSSNPSIAYLHQIPAQMKNWAGPVSIYLPSDGIIYFVQHILPKLSSPFVIVSGDSDLPIDEQSLGGSLRTLLESPFLLAWFAQNRNYEHPKLHSLPIGINIHNLWANPLNWGGGFILPAMQELELQTIARKAPALPYRAPKVFCNWHFSIDRADRMVCYDQIDHSVCLFQPKPLPATQTWQLQSQYQFVLSPHGAGLDCHRTWEALLLGCIPIIKEAKLNDLFTDLPVVIISDWGQINALFLKEALQSIQQKMVAGQCNQEKLYMRYWKERILATQL